jgi:hypothetical protein
MASASLGCGRVMGTMTAETIVMKMNNTAVSVLLRCSENTNVCMDVLSVSVIDRLFKAAVNGTMMRERERAKLAY